MSTKKKIQFTTFIEAPASKVWAMMLGPETYKEWTTAFTPGSYYEGFWDRGEKIKFLAPSGEGMIAEIAENEPESFVSIRHLGCIKDGVVDTDSPAVKAWVPAYENYRFESLQEGTKLTVDLDITTDFEQYMLDTWPQALEALKRMCEQV